VLAGYDRDFSQLEPDTALRPTPPKVRVRRLSGWEQVRAASGPARVQVPAGIELDLGATAKALCADRAAHAAAQATGGGVLVSLGGDIATAGPTPDQGWPIHVTDDHRNDALAPGQTIILRAGGIATSSTTVRRWRHHARSMHHILDPSTGEPVEGPWRTVSVVAASCLDANIASTAVIVLGARGLGWLRQTPLSARLVTYEGRVTLVGEWPREDSGMREVA
jgi:thiamine biosynthesis lipoprotein